MLVTRLAQPRMRRGGRRSNFYRPMLDPLEDRLTPSCTVNVIDADGNGSKETLRIIGDDLAQNVRVLDGFTAGVSARVSVDCNDDGDFTDEGELDGVDFSEPIRKYDLRLLGGDDTVLFSTQADFNQLSKNVKIHLGSGNNTLTLDGESTSMDRASLKFKVISLEGADNVTLELPEGNIAESNLRIVLNTGAGPDEVFIDGSASMQDGAVVDADVLLGPGNNHLTWNAAETFEGDGTFDLKVVGSNRVDEQDLITANINVDLKSPGRVFAAFSLLAGNDFLLAEFGAGFGSTDENSDIHLQVSGGAGDDSLLVQGIDLAGNGGMDLLGLLDLAVNGDAGTDRLFINFSGGEGVNLGGTLQYRAKGGSGNDSVGILLLADVTSTGTVDAALLGAAGEDELSIIIGIAPGATLEFGPLAAILLDGGADNDTATVLGNVPVQKLNCEA